MVRDQNKTVSLDEVNTYKDRLVLLYIYFLPQLSLHGFKVGMTICKIGESFWHAIKSRIDAQEYELALDSDLLENRYEKYGMDREVLFGGFVLTIKMITSKTMIFTEKSLPNYLDIQKRIKNGSRVISL